MIEPIDDVLRRLLAQSGAAAAVVWVQRSDPATATVLTSCPAGLIAPGYGWPAGDDIVTDVVRHSPAHLAVAVPSSLRLHLPQPPTAAQTFQLGGSNLFLVLIWGDHSTIDGVDPPTRHLIDHDVSRLALLAELSRSDHNDAERMRAMLDHLDEGVAAVNPVLGQADINPAAAKFLGLAPGRVTVSDFAEAMAKVIGRATNRSDIVEANRRQLAGADSHEATWRFAEEPTHVRVRSRPLTGGADGGRIWEFANVSAIERALQDSEQSRAVTAAATDALLDPMVSLAPVRDRSGQIVDFTYSLVNQATVEYLRTPSEELLGRGVVELMPGLKAELFEGYVRSLQTGEPLVLNDFSYDNEILEDTRRYDIRASRSTPNSLTLTWRDVTDRFVAAQELEKAHELLRASADATLDPYLLAEAITDPSGEIVDLLICDVNSALCDFISLPARELVNRNVLEIWPNLANSELMAHYAACATTGEPVLLNDVEYFIERLTTTRRFDIRGARVRPGLITLTYRDVTDRFETAQRILKSEEQYRLVTENVGSVVTRIGPDGTYLWMSGSVQDVLGAPPEYYIGRKVWDFVAPDDIANDTARQQTLARGEPYNGRARILDADATPHWIQLFARPFINAEGNSDGFVSTFSLIDAEVAAEQELAEARRQRARADVLYRQTVENAAVGTCLADLDGNFVEVNPALCRFFGYDAEALLGMTWLELTAPDYLQADLDSRARLMAGDIDSYRMTKEFIHADGHPIWGDLSVSGIRGPGGAVEVFIGQITDITEEVRSREKLERAQRLLAASADSMLNPQVLLEAIRDSTGRLTDFRFVSVNQACSKYLQVSEDELIGHSVADSSVLDIKSSGLMGRYAQCLETGQPVILDDFAFVNEMLDNARRYDIRATRAGADLLSLTWSDVTERYQAARRLEQARDLLKASTDAMLDPQCLVEAMTDPAGTVVDLIFRDVNQAYCDYLGASRSDFVDRSMLALFPNLVSSGLMALYARCATTGESVELEDFAYVFDPVGEERRFDIRVAQVRPGLITGTIRDTTERSRAAQRLANSEEQYRLLAENSSDVIIHGRDGKVVWASPSVGEVLGGTPEYWIGRPLKAVVPPDQEAEFDARQQALAEGHAVQQRTQLVALDGTRRWIHLHSKPFYDSDGRRDGFTAALRPIDDEVRAEHQLDEARKQQAKADERFRRSMDNAAVGMGLLSPQGTFIEVNDAICRFFGYDAETLRGKTWQEITAADYLQADKDMVDDVLAGRRESYQMLKQYIHADGHLIWGDLSVSCTRDAHGQVEQFLSQITDITDTVEANARNDELNSRLKEELQSAADYMATIMPAELTGAVDVSSRYLPSQELGGDCFDYRWIDDEHLVVYLIDVSGHGIEPALLAVSLQNILRSGTLGAETMRNPAAVLTELNRLFQMEQQNEHFFTLWYGVYEKATRTLRYSSAAAPPAYAFSRASGDGVTATELMTRASPIGAFPDTEFTASSFHVPPGCRILIYSDGASELTLRDGGYLRQAQFETLATGVAGSPDWSIDDLAGELRDLTLNSTFDDDVSLIRVAFD